MWKWLKLSENAVPMDGRIEKRESIRVKEIAAKKLWDMLSHIDRRYHELPVAIDRREQGEALH